MLPLGVEKWQGTLELLGPLHAYWTCATRERAASADAGRGAERGIQADHARHSGEGEGGGCARVAGRVDLEGGRLHPIDSRERARIAFKGSHASARR